MKKIKIIFSLLILSVCAQAQFGYSWRMNYDVAIPMGQFSSDYINQSSWRGISIDNRWEIQPNLTVGFNLGWQVFSQRFNNVTQTFSGGRTTVNGTQFRFVNTYPIQANAHYYFGYEFGIRPWAGISMGTAFTDQRTQVGFIELKATSWSFALTPQVGVDIPISSDNTAFTLNVSYNYFMQNQVSYNYSFLVIGAGFKFVYF